VIRCKHSSIRTEEAYTNWVRRFILFHGKRPKIETIRMFLDRQELLGQTEIIGQQEEQGEALPPGAGRSAGSRLGNPTAPNALNHGCRGTELHTDGGVRGRMKGCAPAPHKPKALACLESG